MPRGAWYYSAEEDVGYCGALRTHATIVDARSGVRRVRLRRRADARAATQVSVIPRDGLRVRFHVVRGEQRLHMELDHDGFAKEQPVVVSDALDRMQFMLENRTGGAHETGLWIAGLPEGNYAVSVDGRPAGQLAGSPRRTKVIDRASVARDRSTSDHASTRMRSAACGGSHDSHVHRRIDGRPVRVAARPRLGARSSGTIAVDAGKPGHAIPSNLYGIFFEEISHAGEGGLYAELIQNRGFEDSRLPPMCKLENGFIVPPRTPHFDTGKPNDCRLRWNVTSETPAWTLDAAGATASMRLTDAAPLTEATPHSLLVEVKDLAPGRAVAVRNEGFWGINVQEGAQYKLSLYARTEGGFKGPLTARLESADGRELAVRRWQAT